MKFLELYGPSIVLGAWAVLIVVIGRSDVLAIVGLVGAAVALWFHGRGYNNGHA